MPVQCFSRQWLRIDRRAHLCLAAASFFCRRAGMVTIFDLQACKLHVIILVSIPLRLEPVVSHSFPVSVIGAV